MPWRPRIAHASPPWTRPAAGSTSFRLVVPVERNIPPSRRSSTAMLDPGCPRWGLYPGILQHDAFYRAGELGFHAYWECWDVQWLFHLGPREGLEVSFLQRCLQQAGIRTPIPPCFQLASPEPNTSCSAASARQSNAAELTPAATLQAVCSLLQQLLPRVLDAARSDPWRLVPRGRKRRQHG